jgi:succinoglycan biosynthesis transport protein ExoP
MNSQQLEKPQSSFLGFELYWLMLKRRWLPATACFLAVFCVGALITSVKKPIYKASGKLIYNRTIAASSLTNLGAEVEKLRNNSQELVNETLTTESQVIRSTPVVREAITQLGWKTPQGKPFKPEDFIKHLKVEDIRATKILEVSYQDTDPTKATLAANTLMKVYLKNNIAFTRAETLASRKFLEEQLPKAEATVNQAEIALRRFKEKHKIVSLAKESESIVTLINNLQEKIINTKSEVANLKSRSGVLQKKLGAKSEEALTITKLGQSPEIKEVADKLQQAQSQLATQKAIFTDNNPAIVEQENTVAKLKNLMQQRIAKQLGSHNKAVYGSYRVGQLEEDLTNELIKIEANNIGLDRQLKELSYLEKNYRQRASILPGLEQAIGELEGNLKISQATYSSLLEKLQEVRIAENQNIGNFRIVAEAVVPEEPASSKSSSYLISAIFAGLVATAVVCLLEATDNSIKTVEEARNIFGYTWLGIIPSLNKPKKLLSREEQIELSVPQLVVRDNPSSPVSESYRMLQSNIKFLSSDRKFKIIVITSSVSGEGKSKVAANLASAMAQVGQKVLLLDADLHHPMQHKIWDLYNNNGLSNLIAEKIDSRSAIEPVMMNLDVLTSGVVPPSPATLLDSQMMSSTIEGFAKDYDFVIIDTPALDFAADAPIVGRMADGVILVVKPGLVNANKATFAKEILERSGQKVLGIVINGIVPEPNSYYYHALESKQESSESLGLPKESKEELWETVSRLARESKKTQFYPDFNVEALTNTPVENLQEMVTRLQEDLDKLVELVGDQEEELNLQRQTVKELQQQLNFANPITRSEIEEQLIQEQEKNRMLYKTLVGQRRNLEKRQQAICQCQDFLQRRQEDKFSGI